MAKKRSHIVLHTTAFRHPADISLVKQWHTDPRLNEDTGRLFYQGKWYNSDTDLPQNVRGKRGNGWNDVGYHYFIRKSGEIQKGREEHVNGAHCADGGMNSKSLGICFEGHHNFEPWTQEQWSTFKRLLKDIFTRHTIPTANIIGHREAGSNKDCPGTQIDMNNVRSTIGQWRVGTI